MDDLAAFLEIRNDKATAEFQSWTVPYPAAKLSAMIAHDVAGEPAEGRWFNYAIADPVSDTLIGAVAVRMEWGGRSAEIGYTLAPNSRGRGIATGAASWAVTHLFDVLGVKRVHAALHPDNFASMMLLERLGFVYEGTARQSFWVEDRFG